MLKRNERGYALLELLLVVILLGILASMAVPRFVTSRDEAQRRACYNNLHAINSEIEEYYFMTGSLPTNADYNTIVDDTGRFPDGARIVMPAEFIPLMIVIEWSVLFMGHYSLASKNILFCSFEMKL